MTVLAPWDRSTASLFSKENTIQIKPLGRSRAGGGQISWPNPEWRRQPIKELSSDSVTSTQPLSSVGLRSPWRGFRVSSSQEKPEEEVAADKVWGRRGGGLQASLLPAHRQREETDRTGTAQR